MGKVGEAGETPARSDKGKGGGGWPFGRMGTRSQSTAAFYPSVKDSKAGGLPIPSSLSKRPAILGSNETSPKVDADSAADDEHRGGGKAKSKAGGGVATATTPELAGSRSEGAEGHASKPSSPRASATGKMDIKEIETLFGLEKQGEASPSQRKLFTAADL